MPRKHVFGLTPWGQAFIEAIERLGDEGRLDRGRAYAGNGRVERLTIEDGQAVARVEGNYRPHYTVKISFPTFTAKDRRALVELIQADPLVAAKLETGSLPPELLERIEKAGIDLFPKRWSEMRRSCTCPDYGDPCKHEAAVYYIIAQEIDRNPLALFKLRGLDLEALRDTGTAVPGQIGASPFPIADPLPLRLVEAWEEELDPAALSPNFLPLSSYAGLLPKLLPPGPALAGLDLPIALAEFYHRLVRDWEMPFLAPEPRRKGRQGRGAENGTGATDLLSRGLSASGSRVLVEGRTCGIVLASGEKLSLFETVRQVLSAETVEGSPSFRFLRRFSLAMRSIVAAGALRPAVGLEGGMLSAVWKPAGFGDDVRGALSWIGGAARAEFVEYAPASSGKPRRGRPRKDEARPSLPNRASLIDLMAASFLRDYIVALRFSPEGRYSAESPVARVLFAGEAVEVSSPAFRSLPAALAARFSVYELAERRSGFELTIKTAPGRRSAAEGAGDGSSDLPPRFRLSASLPGTGGKRRPLARAAGGLGQEALAFPALLSNFVPGLGALGTKLSVELGEEELSGFVLDAAPLLSRIGVSVVLPKVLSKLARPRPVLSARRKGSKPLATAFDLATAFSFDWKIAIGEELVDPAEFRRLMASGRSLFRFKESYVRLDPAEAKAILERLKEERKPDALGAVRAALAGDVELTPELSAALSGLLGGGGAGGRSERPASLPEGLRATLRHYQERGYRWLLDNLEHGFGCLLADDMGLGKTVQTIALTLALKDSGRLVQGALVIAPASLLTNWERELGRFAPSLSVYTHYGAKRRLQTADVVLTTYDTFLRDSSGEPEREWDLVVLDEAHLVKNPDAKRSRAVRAVKASRRIALTGTPVENNLAELWSIFDFAIPGYLGGLERFAREFRRPIEVGRSKEAAERLKRITSPFILRRLKTDKTIAPELPDKLVINEYASLTAEQAALYEATVTEGLRRIETAEGIERSGFVLSLITALKQIANHPRNWDKESPPEPERSGKTRLLLALLDAAMEAGERVLVFSQYVEMLDILGQVSRTELGVEPYVLHGGMPKRKRDEAVDRFQSEEGPGVFLISLKAGGVGLNLTAASRVIHYDLWFNPAVENQATDRAFRIGQTKNVFVHRLVTRGTLEERIDAILERKRELAELTVGAGETWISELSNAELRELVSLER